MTPTDQSRGSLAEQPLPVSPVRRLIECAALAAVLLAFFLSAARGIGVTWDETIYIRFADSITKWLSADDMFSAETIEKYWAYSTYHNPHPPFMKILSAVTATTFHDVLSFPSDYRLATLLYMTISLTVVYGLLRTVARPLAALAAVLFVALQPRLLGDMLLATHDAPVAMAWLLAPLLAWKIVEAENERTARRYRLGLIVLYAFAVATKFTGLLIIIPIAGYFLLQRRFREIWTLGDMLMVSFAFMVAISPEKWHQPVGSMIEYLTYPFTRPSYPMNTLYFGQQYSFHLPWHYFSSMSAVTYPVPLWLLLPGLVFCPPRIRRLLIPVAVALSFWLVLVHLPNMPRHDGVRQFVSVFPLLGLLSWGGMVGIIERVSRDAPAFATWARSLLPPAMVVLLAAALWRNHPHELSYYNELIGGIRGAEQVGMEITYYLESVDPGLIEALNRVLDKDKMIDVVPYWPDLLRMYREKGELKAGFKLRREESTEVPDYLLVFRRRAAIDDLWYRGLHPIYEVKYDGVSMTKLVSVAK